MTTFRVTGGTEADGDYSEAGVYNGQPYYRRGSDEWYLSYRFNRVHLWYISSEVGATGDAYWFLSSSSVSPVGEYVPQGTATETATVSEVTIPATTYRVSAVAGQTLAPDATGDYTEAGVFDGESYYRRMSDEWYLYIYGAKGARWWCISQTLGLSSINAWSREASLGVVGEYNPGFGETGIATVSEVASDSTPDEFAFAPVGGAEPSQAYTSDAQTITGMSAGTEILISGDDSPEYRINGGAWTAYAGTMDPGDTIEIRARSAAAFSATSTVEVTIGTVTREWVISTRPARQYKWDVLTRFELTERL